jgi:hypothetical protein
MMRPPSGQSDSESEQEPILPYLAGEAFMKAFEELLEKDGGWTLEEKPNESDGMDLGACPRLYLRRTTGFGSPREVKVPQILSRLIQNYARGKIKFHQAEVRRVLGIRP